MAADPRIERLKIALQDTTKNPYFHGLFDKKAALEYLQDSASKTGLVFRPNPDAPDQYFLILKVDNDPFIPSEDILIEFTKDGYVMNTTDGKHTYPTLETFLLACRNFADMITDSPELVPSDEDITLARAFFEDSMKENPFPELKTFLEQNKLAMENLICGITFELMQDPMLGSEGIHYDNRAINQWLSQKGTSPHSRKPMDMKDFSRSVKVMQAINMIVNKVREIKAKEKQEAEDKLAASSPEFKLAREIGRLMSLLPGKKPGFIPYVSLGDIGRLIVSFGECGKHGWHAQSDACDDFIEILRKSKVEFFQLSNIHGAIKFTGPGIIKLAKLFNLTDQEIEHLFANKKLDKEYAQIKEQMQKGQGVLIFSKTGDKKAEKEASITFAPPTYTYDEERNLFNLVLATEALLNQFPDKEQGFKPRIEMDPKTGSLLINFADLKHSWNSPDYAVIQFLDALKRAGIIFDKPLLEYGGKLILQGRDVIKYAKFCNMPEPEIAFMYINRGLNSLYEQLKEEEQNLMSGAFAGAVPSA